MSEDCLSLNVWTPTADRQAKLPVMVWIHGGAFVHGSGSRYGAQRLSSLGNIVVVTLNYRLGALGFLAHPALAHQGGVGNFGIMDQQLALRWVRDNIVSFGGDPTKVTIAGESAGAISVCDHLVSPASAGLFRSAIIQSGPCAAQATQQTAEQASLQWAYRAGCSDQTTVAQCLRDLPQTEILSSPIYARIGPVKITGPVTGGKLLPYNPIEAFRSNIGLKVPVMIGANHDEFTMFTFEQRSKLGPLGPTNYRNQLEQDFGPSAPAIAELYPISGYGNRAESAYSAVYGDFGFACVMHSMLRGLSRNTPTYGYEFNDSNPPVPVAMADSPFPLGASHGFELPYLFDHGHSGWPGVPPLTIAQQKLSDLMIMYWASFVANSAPQLPNEPKWPRYNDTEGQILSLRSNDVKPIIDFAESHKCDIW